MKNPICTTLVNAYPSQTLSGQVTSQSPIQGPNSLLFSFEQSCLSSLHQPLRWGLPNVLTIFFFLNEASEDTPKSFHLHVQCPGPLCPSPPRLQMPHQGLPHPSPSTPPLLSGLLCPRRISVQTHKAPASLCTSCSLFPECSSPDATGLCAGQSGASWLAPIRSGPPSFPPITLFNLQSICVSGLSGLFRGWLSPPSRMSASSSCRKECHLSYSSRHPSCLEQYPAYSSFSINICE